MKNEKKSKLIKQHCDFFYHFHQKRKLRRVYIYIYIYKQIDICGDKTLFCCCFVFKIINKYLRDKLLKKKDAHKPFITKAKKLIKTKNIK